ncbi:hypothetical protein [Lactobacillus sp. LL6]|uniref:hypothetical protein n=1 Tax=Lactobacillus sp. LL6 TaxID=2596827 RepID=UPI0016433233|nr:hypothetical protein [Lactobacillus sp. LL6]
MKLDPAAKIDTNSYNIGASVTSPLKITGTIDKLNKSVNVEGVGNAMAQFNEMAKKLNSANSAFNVATQADQIGNTFQFQGNFLVALFFILKSSKLTPNASAILQIVSK